MRTTEEFKQYIDRASDAEIAKIINGVSWIISSRHAGIVLFRAIVGGEMFAKDTLQPLAEMINWTEEDDDIAKKLMEKFEQEIERKTPKEKRSALKEVLTIIGTAVLSGTTGFVAGRLLKKNNKAEEKNKEPTS